MGLVTGKWELRANGGVAAAIVAALLFAGHAHGQDRCEGLVLSEVAVDVGVDFVHDRGATGEYHEPETLGSGLTWVDFDNDGWLDLYVLQSGSFPPQRGADAANRLFRNTQDGRFVEVADAAGAGDRGYGQGAISADVNGDGLDDLVVTNFGPDSLYLNRGGRYEQVPLTTDAVVEGWSSSLAAADADGDGDLDLYIVGYLKYDLVDRPRCRAYDGDLDYCHPDLFEAQPDHFLRNRGDGTFENATSQAGLDIEPGGKGLGVVFTDFDLDGDQDVYVANDATLNFLFENQGDGTFLDVSLISGTALNEAGQPQAGMGVSVGDIDGNGLPEIAVTNLDVETNALYRNDGGLSFRDISATGGFGFASYNLLGFGIVLADLNGDLMTDVYVANGHVLERPMREGVTSAQGDFVLFGDGTGRFVSQDCGDAVKTPHRGRGLAPADYDNDGDLDIAISGSNQPLRLLRNDSPAGDWIGVVLRGRGANTAAVGAVVRLETPGGAMSEWMLRGESYLASGDPRALFALPAPLTGEEVIEITWPSGARTQHGVEATMIGRYTEIREPAPGELSLQDQ